MSDHHDQLFTTHLHAEVARARVKFPGQSVTTTALALMEEVGEVTREILEGGSSERIWNEAVQVASMALRLATEHANG